MKTTIIQTHNPLLKSFIQYFIFFRSDKEEIVNYTTFPNTNLCLAIYKQNNLNFKLCQSTNQCSINSGKSTYLSHVLGFHKSAFQVNIKAPVDQICILFQPTALRAFTNIPYQELQQSNRAFQLILNNCDHFFLEILFQEQNLQQRAFLLEQALLRNLNGCSQSKKINEVLLTIEKKKETKIEVGELAKDLSMTESTLYRLFIDQMGQSPKAFLKTLRFRNILNDLLLYDNVKLSHVAYDNHYADQAHFIKDFKTFSGESPKYLKAQVTIEQKELAWVYSCK